jgi:hypothetical protein
MLKALFQIEAQRSGVTVLLTIEPNDDGTLSLKLPGGRPRQNAAAFTIQAADFADVLAAAASAGAVPLPVPAAARRPRNAARRGPVEGASDAGE